jgi:xanthine dehydrogenase accessory factor
VREILSQLLAATRAGRPLVYTALVETRGSTPQKAGAKMLVFPDGSQVGTLGGGCVEAEVKRRALELLSGTGGRELMTFQLDNDYGWDDGLICGGRMTMLVDPLRAGGDAAFYEQMHAITNAGSGFTEAVSLDDSAGRWLFDAHGTLLVAGDATDEASESVAAGLKPLIDRPRPYVVGGVSYLPQLTRCRLVIVGAGHVGERVASLASDVDFDVWVIDDRETYCNAERFPRAQKLIVGSIDDVLANLEVDPSTFCIIVTRGHNHDEQALFHLAETPARYVGMIGSKRKIRLIFDDLRREGISEEALSCVRAPLGFDIGSQTVPEIAVSIVAELIAERNLGRGASQPFRTATQTVAEATS